MYFPYAQCHFPYAQNLFADTESPTAQKRVLNGLIARGKLGVKGCTICFAVWAKTFQSILAKANRISFD